MSLFTRVRNFFSPHHLVKKGDTLSAIAEHYYGDADKYLKIYDANRDQLDSPDKIYVGQILIIPY